ncbi:MAG TPA: hypothetical protein VI298_08710 [Geobacteraceae bacterium]
MTISPEVWDIIKLVGGAYIVYLFNKADRSQTLQTKINSDLYEKYNALSGSFHELLGEHKARRANDRKEQDA